MDATNYVEKTRRDRHIRMTHAQADDRRFHATQVVALMETMEDVAANPALSPIHPRKANHEKP